ncbi:MAG: GNAT family N-acetyltransferase [Pseudomonadota bacterium]
MTEFECVEPDTEVYADYATRFGPYNQQQSGWHVQTYSMVLRADAEIVAAGRGHVYLGVLEVRSLWVDTERRSNGLGSDLLQAIEREGISRGARKALLYTYSWQAEGFYKRHGYREFARFGFPDGHFRIDMEKTL